MLSLLNCALSVSLIVLSTADPDCALTDYALSHCYGRSLLWLHYLTLIRCLSPLDKSHSRCWCRSFSLSLCLTLSVCADPSQLAADRENNYLVGYIQQRLHGVRDTGRSASVRLQDAQYVIIFWILFLFVNGMLVLLVMSPQVPLSCTLLYCSHALFCSAVSAVTHS